MRATANERRPSRLKSFMSLQHLAAVHRQRRDLGDLLEILELFLRRLVDRLRRLSRH